MDVSFLNSFSIDLEFKVKTMRMTDKKHKNIKHDIIISDDYTKDSVYFRAYYIIYL